MRAPTYLWKLGKASLMQRCWTDTWRMGSGPRALICLNQPYFTSSSHFLQWLNLETKHIFWAWKVMTSWAPAWVPLRRELTALASHTPHPSILVTSSPKSLLLRPLYLVHSPKAQILETVCVVERTLDFRPEELPSSCSGRRRWPLNCLKGQGVNRTERWRWRAFQVEGTLYSVLRRVLLFNWCQYWFFQQPFFFLFFFCFPFQRLVCVRGMGELCGEQNPKLI